MTRGWMMVLALGALVGCNNGGGGGDAGSRPTDSGGGGGDPGALCAAQCARTNSLCMMTTDCAGTCAQYTSLPECSSQVVAVFTCSAGVSDANLCSSFTAMCAAQLDALSQCAAMHADAGTGGGDDAGGGGGDDAGTGGGDDAGGGGGDPGALCAAQCARTNSLCMMTTDCAGTCAQYTSLPECSSQVVAVFTCSAAVSDADLCSSFTTTCATQIDALGQCAAMHADAGM